MKASEFENTQIADFYDTFNTDAVHVKSNLRHYHIFSRLVEIGLKKNDSVLEVGCGSGALTTLIHAYVKRGKITGVDISPASIAYAKKRFKKSNRTSFWVSDMSDFEYDGKFDLIVMPDVIEHIPIKDHLDLFQKMRKHMHDSSILAINIPNPKFLEKEQKDSNPDLQIIDQPIHTDVLAKNLMDNDLIIDRIENYSLFYKVADYTFIVAKPNIDVKAAPPMPKPSIIRRKLFKKVYHKLKVLF